MGGSSYDLDACKSLAWTTLINHPFCKIRAVVPLDSKIPRALRVYFEKEAISSSYASSSLTDMNALLFEANFKRCLADDWIIEAAKKKSKDAVEFRTTLHICENIFWCFSEKSFVFEQAPLRTISLMPSAVVSSVTDHWKETLIQQHLVNRRKIEPILLITESPLEWIPSLKNISATYLIADSKGLPVVLPDIVLLAPTLIASTVMNSLDVYDVLSNAMNSISSGLGSTKSHAQLRRFVKDNLALKFPNFTMPVDFHSFHICLSDGDFSYNCSKIFENHVAKRWIRIFKVDDLKPQMVLSQIKDILGTQSNFGPIVSSLYEPILIPVPKTVIKKFKIVGHLVKNGNIEDRISKTFRELPCPLDERTAIERFSGKAMPVQTVKDHIKRHFDRLEVTFGCYLLGNGASFPLSRPFIEEAFDIEKRCTICFDLLVDVYGLTFCGHIYCRDCSKQYFKPHWSVFQPKECAHCRTPLTSGDYFCVDNNCTYEITLASKELGIIGFKESLRSKQIETWPTDVASKYMIINNIDTVKAVDVVRTFSNAQSTINIHIFYTTFETHKFQCFQSSFQ